MAHAHFSETLGGRVREAHHKQIKLALRVAGSGLVDPVAVQEARAETIAAMEDLISEIYRGIEPSQPGTETGM